MKDRCSSRADDVVVELVDREEETELIRIVDESGKGFGLDLTPSTVAKPLGFACLFLFGAGLAGGVPLGMAMSSIEFDQEKPIKGGQRNKVPDTRARISAFMVATKAFVYGTLLCGAFGVAGVYGLHRYFEVNSIEEFGQTMRTLVPKQRKRMEDKLEPWLHVIRLSARGTLPERLERLRTSFDKSRFGRWVKNNVKSSVERRETPK